MLNWNQIVPHLPTFAVGLGLCLFYYLLGKSAEIEDKAKSVDARLKAKELVKFEYQHPDWEPVD